MLLASMAIIVGLILLVISADRFVLGASGVAYNLGVSPFMIGLTIVAFGTSAPEIFVSATAAFQNNPNLAVGNAIGSNIANIGLVLGSTALIIPVLVQKSIMRSEIPIMFVIMIICYLVFFNQYLSFIEGVGLIVCLLIFIIYSVICQKKPSNNIQESTNLEIATSTKANIAWLIAGLVFLVISSKILVWGAVEIATAFGVSDLIIGLTIVAIGTSLPEVATSITSALKGEADLAVGNIVGSNIFNILAVIGIAGIIAPTSLNPDVLNRDILVMFAITILFLILATPWKSKHLLTRTGGVVLLLSYFGYLGYLVKNTI